MHRIFILIIIFFPRICDAQIGIDTVRYVLPDKLINIIWSRFDLEFGNSRYAPFIIQVDSAAKVLNYGVGSKYIPTNPGIYYWNSAPLRIRAFFYIIYPDYVVFIDHNKLDPYWNHVINYIDENNFTQERERLTLRNFVNFATHH